MPLASSMTSVQKRGETVERERRQQERRHEVVTGRRLSLPSTIQSTTVATKAKAERRRSIRRESSAGSLSNGGGGKPPAKAPSCNENEAPVQNHPYSPPETRSVKKKKHLNPDFMENATRTAAVLQFSPPNQATNERREREHIQRREEERARRIEQARRNGQLIVLSPSNREHKLCLDFSPSKMARSNSSLASSGSRQNDDLSSADQTILRKLAENMALIAENQAEAIETSRNSEANLLKKVHELFMAESQAAIQSTLEQKNESLMTELRELNEKFASEKEKYSVHSTRLELQLKQTQEHVEKLQMLQCDMELQIATMNDEESELTKRAAMLEAHLKDATTKLQHDKALLIALQQESVFEKKSLSMEAEQLTATNHQLEAQLDETKQSNAALDETIASYEKKIEQLEREVIPNLEAALETERDSVARMEAELENRFTELEDSKAAISALEQHVAELQKRNEEEHQRFQMLNEGSNKAFEKMTLAADEKDRQIAVLQQELEQSQQSMDVEHQRMIETNENLQQAKDKLISEQMQLNDALEESMLQLDHIETERKELEKKLAKALDLLEQAKNAVESKDSKTFLIVEGLKGQIADERKRREDAELIRNEAEILAREKDQKIKGLEKSLKQTLEERDMARNNMNGFNEREQELYLMLRESDRIRREMHSRIMQLMGNIRVFVRVRPPLPGEIDKEHRLIAAKSSEDCKKRKRAEDNDDEVMTFRFPGVYDRGGEQKRHVSSSGDDLTKNLIEVQEPYKDRGGLKDRRKKWRFGFDSVFPPTQGQDEVWEATEPLIQCAVDGYNVTIFAYGQTGSGKTYTMLGEDGNDGLIGRSVRKIFEEKREVETLSRGETHVSVSVELLEVYNEKVRDLLSADKDQDLKVLSNEVVGNIVVQTNAVDEVMKVLALAQRRRCVKATGSNSESSRSHMIFMLHFNVTAKDGVERSGKLNICDLAGSERLDKSGTNVVGGALLEESKNINKSLSVLSNVIERLQAGDPNVPFRESKLTFLLKNSLNGNSKTLAIICCNPLITHVNESLCSLRFAEKVNRVDLKAVTNFSC